MPQRGLSPQPLTNNQKKKEQRGLRLASDFSFPKEWEDFCQQTRPELSPVKTFDQFKDFEARGDAFRALVEAL